MRRSLICSILPNFGHWSKRKAIATGKFYFFDPGVVHCLLGRTTVAPRTPEYGKAFEHLLFCELRAHLSYARLAFTLSHFRTATGSEVDFILDRKSSIVAIEAKAKKHVTEQDLKGLRAFKDEHPKTVCYVVCEESAPRTTEDGIQIMPLQLFLEALWQSGAGAL